MCSLSALSCSVYSAASQTTTSDTNIQSTYSGLKLIHRLLQTSYYVMTPFLTAAMEKVIYEY
jgi:hypothetical protein